MTNNDYDRMFIETMLLSLTIVKYLSQLFSCWNNMKFAILTFYVQFHVQFSGIK